MVVFPHSCLPLTSNLRPRGSKDKNEAKPDDEKEFLRVVRLLIESVREGNPAKEVISWTYDYESLWSPKLVTTKGRRLNIWKCSRETFTEFLRSRTYWYKRLPKNGRNRVKKLGLDSKGRRFLKDVLDTADGVLLSTIFAFPELFRTSPYTVSDRIINSVIMNCLSSYSKFQVKLKAVRKEVRHHMMNGTWDDPIDHSSMRMMSFWVLPLKIMRLKVGTTSKEWMFRVAMFCQTRATGLAGTKQLADSVNEFIQTVCTTREYKPNDLLKSCIEQVTDHLADQVLVGINPEFRISMSTSACRESSKKYEGKFGFLKKLVSEYGISIPDFLSEHAPGFLGNWLWPIAIDKIKMGQEDVRSVNVAAIRENGKARVVTSGSFWKETALQPFSHISINLIKVLRNLSSGLGAGRLGWRFIEKISWTENDKDGLNWIFDPRIRKYIYSTDWGKATDWPTPEMGRDVTGSLLRKTGLDADTLHWVLEYWVGPKELFYKGKHVGTLRCGIPMGDPLTKTNLSLAHPICDLYARRKTGARAVEEGNGDDTVAITDKKEYAEAHLEAAEMLGYKRSDLDECISSSWGTYCEEMFYIPQSKINSCKWGSRFKNSLLLPYLDFPKIRVMIATHKDRDDFSSDPRGKVSLLGHDEEYINENDPGPLKSIFAIASAFQDITLSTISRPEPLFLPRQINGVGKPPPFWSKTSWMNIMNRCTPWHRKYYLTVMDELNSGTVGVSSLRGSLRPNQHFEKEAMVEFFSIPEEYQSKLEPYLEVDLNQWDNYPEGLLDKLISLGYLVRESKVAKYYLMSRRLTSLEQDLKQDLFEVVKAEMVKYPDPERETEIIDQFVDNFKEQPWRLSRQRQERLYSDTIYEVLDRKSQLAVTDLLYPLIGRFNKRVPARTWYDQDGETLYQWYKDYKLMFNRDPRLVKTWRPPTFILEDDPVILQEIASRDRDLYVIITDDVRLFKLALRRFPSYCICRMSVLHYLQTWSKLREDGMFTDRTTREFLGDERFDKMNSESNRFMLPTYESRYDQAFSRLIQQKEDLDATVILLRDYGSIESYENKYTGDDVLYQTIGIPWRKNIAAKNLEKKPHHGFSTGLFPRSFEELSMPRSLMTPACLRAFRQLMRSLRHSPDSDDSY